SRGPSLIPSRTALGRTALLARLRGRAFPPRRLSLGPFYGLVEPTSDVLPDRVADRVLHGHRITRFHELLEIHDVPLRQFDHELADVVRRGFHVDEAIDRRANRVGDRREVAALDHLMQRLYLVRGNSNRHPLGFRWHMDASPRPTSWVILSDNRMATALFKRTVQTVRRRRRRGDFQSDRRARSPLMTAERSESVPEGRLYRLHPVVHRVAFDVGQAENFERDGHE